jgi:hypothetical protein
MPVVEQSILHFWHIPQLHKFLLTSQTADGTFIETSVGPAARELKKFYDQRLGVSASIRSPYAITAFVNQHGKQMFRIGSGFT